MNCGKSSTAWHLSLHTTGMHNWTAKRITVFLGIPAMMLSFMGLPTRKRAQREV